MMKAFNKCLHSFCLNVLKSSLLEPKSFLTTFKLLAKLYVYLFPQAFNFFALARSCRATLFLSGVNLSMFALFQIWTTFRDRKCYQHNCSSWKYILFTL